MLGVGERGRKPALREKRSQEIAVTPCRLPANDAAKTTREREPASATTSRVQTCYPAIWRAAATEAAVARLVVFGSFTTRRRRRRPSKVGVSGHAFRQLPLLIG